MLLRLLVTLLCVLALANFAVVSESHGFSAWLQVFTFLVVGSESGVELNIFNLRMLNAMSTSPASTAALLKRFICN